KNLGPGGSYTEFPYALYFADGAIQVYENGNGRGQFATYTKGKTYDFRVVTLPGAGAQYFFRLTGDPAYTKVFESANIADSTFRYGGRFYGGTRSFDNWKIQPVLPGWKVTGSISQSGPVTLTVTDNAGLTGTASVQITVVKGDPPVAVIDGPGTGDVG